MNRFRRRPARRPHLTTPPTTTGHALDDALLLQIAAGSDIETPRHWVHYLYVADEVQANSAVEMVVDAGWQIQRVDLAAGGFHGWVVIAESHAVTTATAVREARSFFESVAAAHSGFYDGWEASL